MTKSEPNTTVSQEDPAPLPQRVSGWRKGLRAVQILLPILVLLGAGLGMRWLLQHRVRAKRRKPKPQAVLVEVTPVTIRNHRVVVKAMGKVLPAQQVDLHPRVKGEIFSISTALLPGGLVTKGHVLVRIDPSDYRVAVRQSTSAVKQAQADLHLEQGRQAIAQQELQLLGTVSKGSNRDLVLRGPQLRKTKSSVEAAQASLSKAELDLKRTVIRSPINAVVVSRDADVGTRVTESTRLTRIVGTDAFWVELVVPVHKLRWLRLPVDGSLGPQVRVHDPAAWGKGRSRTGRVLRLAPDLEDKGRMARLVVKVDDPLALQEGNRGKPRLLLGSWVEAVIEGSELRGVAVVDRNLMRDGDNVWVYDARDRLDIRKVTLAYRGRRQVVLSKGLRAGERIVSSDLATPVQGMLLRIMKRRAPLRMGMGR
ncbi:MAG: efflux RND transporter periplasmic adaptor subunit [bacterium]